MEYIKTFEDFVNESILNEEVYYIVKNISSDKYEVKRGSKYSSKSKTGSQRFKNEDDAQTEADKLNSK